MYFRRNLSQSVETISVTSNFDGYSEINMILKKVANILATFFNIIFISYSKPTSWLSSFRQLPKVLSDDSAVSVPCYHCNRYRLYRCKRYQDFSSAFQFAKVIYFFNFWRIESPFNSILLAFATKRSIMASAKVGSPM